VGKSLGVEAVVKEHFWRDRAVTVLGTNVGIFD
jgi:hypothetical protein